MKEVLNLAYNKFHFGTERTFYKLDDFYILRLSKHLKDYIKHCLACLLNRTSREQLYKELQPIRTSLILYYIVAIDFILALPVILVVAL